MCGTCLVWLYDWVPKDIMKINFADTLYLFDKKPASIFSLYLGVYILHYTLHKAKFNDQFQYLIYQKNLLFPLLRLYLLYPIYFKL